MTTKSYSWTLSWASRIKPAHLHNIFPNSCLGLQSDIIPSSFPIIFLFALLISRMRAERHAHFIPLVLMALITPDEVSIHSLLRGVSHCQQRQSLPLKIMRSGLTIYPQGLLIAIFIFFRRSIQQVSWSVNFCKVIDLNLRHDSVDSPCFSQIMQAK